MVVAEWEEEEKRRETRRWRRSRRRMVGGKAELTRSVLSKRAAGRAVSQTKSRPIRGNTRDEVARQNVL